MKKRSEKKRNKKEVCFDKSTDDRNIRKRRTCLGCNKLFWSDHCGHRFCTRCKPRLKKFSSVPKMLGSDLEPREKGFYGKVDGF